MWMKNAYIAEYDFGSYNNHSTRRDRKLLLNRKEYDKRNTLKEKQDRREMDRAMKVRL